MALKGSRGQRNVVRRSVKQAGQAREVKAALLCMHARSLTSDGKCSRGQADSHQYKLLLDCCFQSPAPAAFTEVCMQTLVLAMIVYDNDHQRISQSCACKPLYSRCWLQ
eukprot:scaffold302394_cov21-Tisochrysis_lutea.AAC.1